MYPFTTFTGLEYLQIDIASRFGLDKESWDNRLLWFHLHKHELLDIIHEAEEPALYFAAVMAYYDAVEGKPVTYPISLDATASGMQWLAVLTGDVNAAKLCNVVNTGDREDAYTLVHEMVAALLPGVSVTRADAKRAVMTLTQWGQCSGNTALVILLIQGTSKQVML